MALYMSRIKYLRYVEHAVLTNPTYPNCKVNGMNPYDEQIMSMPAMVGACELQYTSKTTTVKHGHYFFFIFNLSNYFHFLYDTLPYLAHHTNNEHKILLPKDHKWMRFQTEFLAILGYKEFEYAEENVEYEHLYIPSSFTHGKTHEGKWASNEPPSPEARRIWDMLFTSNNPTLPRKFYVSRRTWIHNDVSNIGTNYTTRRKCINEDQVVDTLTNYGYQEIFCENMGTLDKIGLFQTATHIIGFIGGGMANILFSNSKTAVGCITTPDFLTINKRFVHTMNRTRCQYADITRHAPHEGPYSLYVRVKITDVSSSYYGKVGEIEAYADGVYTVKMSNNDVAGFAADGVFATADFSPSQFEALDGGLNSPFVCDLEGLRTLAEYLDKA